MKQTIVFLPLLCLSLFSQAQELPPIDERLYEVFEEKFLLNLQKESPNQVLYYNYFLDHAYEIVPIPDEKTSEYPEITIKRFKSGASINILKVINDAALKRNYHNRTYYRIAKTDKVLVLFSEKEIAAGFNRSANLIRE
jgi:hypothetical protein